MMEPRPPRVYIGFAPTFPDVGTGTLDVPEVAIGVYIKIWGDKEGSSR